MLKIFQRAITNKLEINLGKKDSKEIQVSAKDRRYKEEPSEIRELKNTMTKIKI